MAGQEGVQCLEWEAVGAVKLSLEHDRRVGHPNVKIFSVFQGSYAHVDTNSAGRQRK
jgi:hypothetical protein